VVDDSGRACATSQLFNLGKPLVEICSLRPLGSDLTTDAPHAPAHTTLIPSQRNLTRLVVSKTDSLDASHLTQSSRTRTQHLSKHSFKSRDVNSPLSDAHPFAHGHTLSHSPLQFLCSTHSLITPFPKPQFQVYTAYALGTPTMPPVLQPRKENGSLFPCRCSGAVDPNDSGHHKMVCKNSGMTGAHDHIEDEFVAATRPARIQCTNSKATVPRHADSNHQGDVLITLSRTPRPFVLDVSVPHPYSGSGVYKPSAMQDTYTSKRSTHGQAYESQGYSFLPVIGTTYGRQHDDFIRLQYIIANAQAEYIIQHFQPHKDFKVLAGYCFAGIKGRIGAAFARALAYRALSCTKDGRRRHYNAYGPRDQASNQRLDLPAQPHVNAPVAAAGA